jgi:hypothetical protein
MDSIRTYPSSTLPPGTLNNPVPYGVDPREIKVYRPRYLADERSVQHLGKVALPETFAPAPKDLLRDTPLRYWGYVNEFGESFYDLIAGVMKSPAKAQAVVDKSYGMVGLYVFVDAFDKAKTAYQESVARKEPLLQQGFHATEKFFDAMLFQYGASMYTPAIVIATMRDSLKGFLMKISGNEQGLQDLRHHIQAHAKGPYNKLLAQIKNGALEVLEPTAQRITQPNAPTKAIGTLMKQFPKVSRKVEIGAPIALSLGLIPLIVHPIDAAVSKVLNLTYRPLMQNIKNSLFTEVEQVVTAQTQSFIRHDPRPTRLTGRTLHQHNQPNCCQPYKAFRQHAEGVRASSAPPVAAQWQTRPYNTSV